MSKTQRPLVEAERIAAAIVADLAPFCARIQVAGSVRRHKEVVGDVEMVAIPRYAPAGLFGDCTANLLWEHLHASDAYRFTKGDHPTGRYYQLTLPLHAGVQLDLFLAQPDNWGLTLLVRTGSAAFSTAMLARWRRTSATDANSRLQRPPTRSGELVRSTCLHPAAPTARRHDHSVPIPDHGPGRRAWPYTDPSSAAKTRSGSR